MRALLDTSVVLGDRRRGFEEWSVSAVTIGELEAGVLLASDVRERAARLRRLERVLAEAPVLPIEHAVATRYGELRAVTGRRPSNDLWIAATALAHGLTLLTADERLAALPLVATELVG